MRLHATLTLLAHTHEQVSRIGVELSRAAFDHAFACSFAVLASGAVAGCLALGLFSELARAHDVKPAAAAELRLSEPEPRTEPSKPPVVRPSPNSPKPTPTSTRTTRSPRWRPSAWR